MFGQRHHPHMRRLGVRLQINIDRGEQHPFPIRRNLRLLDALERHHVFKGERVFALSNERQRRKENCQGEETTRKTTSGNKTS